MHDPTIGNPTMYSVCINANYLEINNFEFYLFFICFFILFLHVKNVLFHNSEIWYHNGFFYLLFNALHLHIFWYLKKSRKFE